MEAGDTDWGRARRDAKRWLRRCGDAWTLGHADDLAQETVLVAWRWGAGMRHRERLWAAVRTIARRLRSRNRRNQLRSRVTCSQAEVDAAAFVAREPEAPTFRVAGHALAAAELRPWVDDALAQLSAFDRQLLRSFYAGAGCAELAARHRRTEACVKTRIHRARRRVQHLVEECVRAADGLGAQ